MAALVTVSQKIRSALWTRRAAGEKQHQLARQAGLHPSVFSSVVNDIIPIREGDPRVLAIAEVLGVPAAEAFTPIRETSKASGR
jgi:hypothetical protein